MKLQGLDPVTHKPIQQDPFITQTEEIHQLEFQDDYQMPPEDCALNQHKNDSCNKEPIGNFAHWMDNPFIWDNTFTTTLGGDSFP